MINRTHAYFNCHCSAQSFKASFIREEGNLKIKEFEHQLIWFLWYLKLKNIGFEK